MAGWDSCSETAVCATGGENIFEAYYTFHAWRGIFLSVDVQRIWNPGYNRDRGPVVVPGMRLHLEL